MTDSQIIDVHAHVYPAGCFTEVIKSRADFKLVDNPRGQSLLYRGSHVMSMPLDQDSLPKRLASMDEAGIGMAILSVGALNIGWAGSGDAAAARFVNDGLAAVCRQDPNRFRFVAVLPCTKPSEMVQELDRALGMGAAGVGIATNVGDLQLHAPELRNFWQEMSRRKLMVLVHPTCPCDAPQNDPGTFLSVGYPGETAMAATKLALSGTLEECPDVKIVWSHLGGGLPMILDRIDRGYQRYSNCPHPPSYLFTPLLLRHRVYSWSGIGMRARDLGRRHVGFRHGCSARAERREGTVTALKNTGWSASDLDDIFGGTV